MLASQKFNAALALLLPLTSLSLAAQSGGLGNLVAVLAVGCESNTRINVEASSLSRRSLSHKDRFVLKRRAHDIRHLASHKLATSAGAKVAVSCPIGVQLKTSGGSTSAQSDSAQNSGGGKQIGSSQSSDGETKGTDTPNSTPDDTSSSSPTSSSNSSSGGSGAAVDNGSMKTVQLDAFTGPMRNPLMGFRDNKNIAWGTTMKAYVPWNQIEGSASDGVDKIKQYSDAQWGSMAAANIKIIPRVYLRYPGNPDSWPSDMSAGDWTSDNFKKRLAALVSKMGQAWNNDGRIAWIEMGIFGDWGEQSNPLPSTDMQTYAGNLFVKAFPNKLISVRRVDCFQNVNYNFGIYADSFGNGADDQLTNNPLMSSKATAYSSNIIGGEVAYDWGSPPGSSPDGTFSSDSITANMVSRVMASHTTGLGWVSGYTPSNAAIAANAAKLQAAFGYRMVIDSVTFPTKITSGQPFGVSFSVHNDGATPFYYNWPVQAVLLDPSSMKPVWSAPFTDTDIRDWQPGSSWSGNAYQNAPKTVKEAGKFTLSNGDVDAGTYYLALSVNDPAGNKPAVRLAIKNYVKGGYHPVGVVSVDGGSSSGLSISVSVTSNSKLLDSSGVDMSLSYSA